MFLDLISCGSTKFLRLIYLVKRIMNVSLNIIPIVLVVMLSIDFGKAMMSGEDGEQKKIMKLVVKRVIFFAAIFCIPSIVSLANMLLGDLGVDFASCYNEVTYDKIQYMEGEEFLVNQAEKLVAKAEKELTMDAVENAQIYIYQVKDEKLKAQLQKRLDVVIVNIEVYGEGSSGGSDGSSGNNDGSSGGDSNNYYLDSYTFDRLGLKKLESSLSDDKIEKLNAFIDDYIKKKGGYGTSEGIAASAVALTYWLEMEGYYLPYYYGGGHGGYGDKNNKFEFANPKWGSKIMKNGKVVKDHVGREILGLDCSALVSWSIRTACNSKFGSIGATAFRSLENVKRKYNINDAEPGDVLIKESSHIKIVLENYDDYLIVVEAVGKSGNVDTSALVFSKHKKEKFCSSKSTSGCYALYSLDEFYDDYCVKK